MKEVLLKETGIELIVTDESPLEQRRKQVVSVMKDGRRKFTPKKNHHLLQPMLLLSFMEWSEYVVHSFWFQHRPTMKKVRKSLALDVMDCKETVTSRHHSIKFGPQPCPKVHSLDMDEMLMLLFFYSVFIDFGFCLVFVTG